MFRPCRGHKRPDGSWDVKTQGKGGFTRISHPRYGLVWARLWSEYGVEMLGWGGDGGCAVFDLPLNQQVALNLHRLAYEPSSRL